MDDNEEIIGGEWLYGSNDDHPDFLWLLTEKPDADTVTEIGLSYANVKCCWRRLWRALVGIRRRWYRIVRAMGMHPPEG